MAKRIFLIGVFLLLVITFLTISNSVADSGNAVNSAISMDIQKALNFPQSPRFQQVINPRQFTFPADHGPHPDYGIEWWYFTGNLSTKDNRHFGYQLTLFRIGLGKHEVERESNWSTSQIYMGHLALSDVQNQKFYAFERFSREALDLAGAVVTDNGSFHVWIEDWFIDGIGSDQPDVRILAREGDLNIDLVLKSSKPITLNGESGFSRKNRKIGGASYYYSCTRMVTNGSLTLGEQNFQVAGLSWMDREWSTSALSEGQAGWDWFGLQLSDGRDLMLYQLIKDNGDLDANSSGTLIEETGSYVSLNNEDFTIINLDHWKSKISGTKYPSKWNIKVPDHGIDITVIPYFKNQEFNAIIRYWEGATSVKGLSNNRDVTGSGYVEITRPAVK
ncbi:MAG: lipocalin-like domain-containing protein [Chloroflexota bacterium]|nr:lipocalin-like domain-containing protein [Chloroflexota bacterium]